VSDEVGIDEEKAQELRSDEVASDDVGQEAKSSVLDSSDLLEFLIRQVVRVRED